jgi:hypothetical protein
MSIFIYVCVCVFAAIEYIDILANYICVGLYCSIYIDRYTHTGITHRKDFLLIYFLYLQLEKKGRIS